VHTPASRLSNASAISWCCASRECTSLCRYQRRRKSRGTKLSTMRLCTAVVRAHAYGSTGNTVCPRARSTLAQKSLCKNTLYAVVSFHRCSMLCALLWKRSTNHAKEPRDQGCGQDARSDPDSSVGAAIRRGLQWLIASYLWLLQRVLQGERDLLISTFAKPTAARSGSAARGRARGRAFTRTR